MGKRAQVVFLDSYSWQAFLDLAAALRDRGVQVSRVGGRTSSPRARLMQRIESLAFGRTTALIEGGTLYGTPVSVDPAALAAAIPAETADVQMQEDLALIALGLGDGPGNPARGVAAGVDPRIVVDKRLQVDHARSLGIPVPDQWDEPVAPAFPVVVKTAVGFGGGGVRIAEDEASLAAAWAELSSRGDAPFLQEFLDRSVSTGGVSLHGEPLVCVAYDGRPAPDDPTGPAQVVVAVEQSDAVEQTAAFLRSIGWTGFFCIDWVADAEGRVRLIDFNARVFGSWAALQELGFDLLGAYLHVLGAAERPAQVEGRYGVPARLLRYPCPPADSSADVLRWRAETLGVVRSRGRILGRRWSTVVRARTALGTARALARVLQSRRAPSTHDVEPDPQASVPA